MKGLSKILRMSIANNVDKFYVNNEIGGSLYNKDSSKYDRLF